MNIFVVLFLILLGIACVGLILILFDDAEADADYRGCIGAIVALIIFCFIMIIVFMKIEPQAIDVYRGKTTLEITYKVVDGGKIVPKDSTVIFK